jgi:DNA-binding response OmpR family regulator
MASILLLEGDHDVRRLLLIVLADLGHTAAALDAGADVPQSTDCLLVDPVAPLHLDQAQQARAQNPGLPIICTSFVKEHAFLEGGPLVHLTKPFTVDQLDAAIELALA